MKAKQNEFRFDARGSAGNPLGSRFQRDRAKNKDLDERYKAIGSKNIDALSQFRADWARKLYANYLEERKRVRTLTKGSWKQGVMIPVGRVAHKEGGGRLGWLNVSGWYIHGQTNNLTSDAAWLV